MKKESFYNLIENPNSVSDFSQEEIDDAIKQYSWFASAYSLKAKQAQLKSNTDFESILSTAAVFSSNRIALFNLIYPSTLKKSLSLPLEPEKLKAENVNELISITDSENEITKTEELLKSLVAKEKLEEEKLTKVVFNEMIVVSEAESNFQISEPESDEKVDAGDYEGEGIIAVENAAKDEEENLSKEFETMSQSGNLIEFVPLDIDEDVDEPEVNTNEVELTSTLFLDNEIEKNELDEKLKDIEIEILSKSEFYHKNEEFENEEEGVFDENMEPELEALKIIEAQNTTDFYTKEKSLITISTEINLEYSFLDWLKKLSDNKEIPRAKEIFEIESAQILSKELIPGKKKEEVLIDYTPDLLTTNNEEDLKLINNFINSKKENKTEQKQSSIIEQAEKSLLNTDQIVTETLARILTTQNKHQSAISMYEKLSLKLPQKSHYFATLIKELKTKL